MRPADTAAADQLDAAVADASRIVTEAAARVGASRTVARRVGFVADLVARLSGLVALGAVTSCAHLTSPRPAMTAAWRLDDALLCPSCASTGLRLSGDADRRCDRCGDVVDVIRRGTVQWGAVMIIFGLCQPCGRALAREQVEPNGCHPRRARKGRR